MSEPPVKWTPLLLRCGKCGHEWDDCQPNGAMAAWLRHVRSLRCPGCKASTGLIIRSLRIKPPDAA